MKEADGCPDICCVHPPNRRFGVVDEIVTITNRGGWSWYRGKVFKLESPLCEVKAADGLATLVRNDNDESRRTNRSVCRQFKDGCVM